MKVEEIVNVDQGYTGPVKLFMACGVKSDDKEIDLSLCNGIKIESEELSKIESKYINKDLVRNYLAWNFPRQELLMTTSVICKKSILENEKEKEFIKNKILDAWQGEVQNKFKDEPVLKIPDFDISVELDEEDTVSLVFLPMELQKGHIWLGSLLLTEEHQKAFEDFCTENIIIKILSKKYKVEESENISDYPCFHKDINSGEIVVDDFLAKLFQRYLLSAAYYMMAQSADDTSILIAKLLLIDPVFGEYMLFTSDREELNEDNFHKQLNKSYKKVEKDKFLSSLFEIY